MQEREYYGVRRGIIKKDDALSFEMFRRGFNMVWQKFSIEGYFQKYFGINCSDGFILGIFGSDLEAAVFYRIKKDLWPIYQKASYYDEVDIYTMIEFLYDYSSKPIKSHWHSWNECGVHVEESDDKEGRNDFRKEINPILKQYKNLELSENGEILEMVEAGFETLFTAKIPTQDEAIQNRINQAQLKFRRTKSTVEDRRDALRDLADVLEALPSQIKTVLMSKDEND